MVSTMFFHIFSLVIDCVLCGDAKGAELGTGNGAYIHREQMSRPSTLRPMITGFSKSPFQVYQALHLHMYSVWCFSSLPLFIIFVHISRGSAGNEIGQDDKR
jgi:hypothetical protein